MKLSTLKKANKLKKLKDKGKTIKELIKITNLSSGYIQRLISLATDDPVNTTKRKYESDIYGWG